MTFLGWAFVVAGTLALIYVYAGFLWLLKMGRLVRPSSLRHRSSTNLEPEGVPGVTVLLSVLNEEDLVRDRLLNLINQKYPPESVEIAVVSDGSVDRTVEEVHRVQAEFPDRRIRLTEFPENLGLAAAENHGVACASHEILLKTDAEAWFPPKLLRAIVRPFDDPTVAVVGCRAEYRNASSMITDSLLVYRAYEWRVREAESHLGVMVKTDGACTAFRRCIWEPLEPYEAVDQVVTLLAQKKGYRSVHLQDAWYVDSTYSHWRQELNARARMTRKGLLSIANRWGWADVRRDPMFSAALLSHKLLRYASPLLVLLLVLGGSILTMDAVASRGVASALHPATLSTGLAIGVALWWQRQKVLSFLIAMVGFLRGWWGWVTSDHRGTYTPSRRLTE